jgi:hypothetical protein
MMELTSLFVDDGSVSRSHQFKHYLSEKEWERTSYDLLTVRV